MAQFEGHAPVMSKLPVNRQALLMERGCQLGASFLARLFAKEIQRERETPFLVNLSEKRDASLAQLTAERVAFLRQHSAQEGERERCPSLIVKLMPERETLFEESVRSRVVALEERKHSCGAESFCKGPIALKLSGGR